MEVGTGDLAGGRCDTSGRRDRDRYWDRYRIPDAPPDRHGQPTGHLANADSGAFCNVLPHSVCIACAVYVPLGRGAGLARDQWTLALACFNSSGQGFLIDGI